MKFHSAVTKLWLRTDGRVDGYGQNYIPLPSKLYLSAFGGAGAIVLGKLSVRGVLLILTKVGQGPTALVVGAGERVVWTSFLSSVISLFFLPLSGGGPI